MKKIHDNKTAGKNPKAIVVWEQCERGDSGGTSRVPFMVFWATDCA